MRIVVRNLHPNPKENPVQLKPGESLEALTNQLERSSFKCTKCGDEHANWIEGFIHCFKCDHTETFTNQTITWTPQPH